MAGLVKDIPCMQSTCMYMCQPLCAMYLMLQKVKDFIQSRHFLWHSCWNRRSAHFA